jgi:hypothetical protein
MMAWMAAAACGGTPLPVRRHPITGVLHVDRNNPRYFADPSGSIVYLTGSHTWSNLQDYGFSDPPPPFAYQAFLDSLVRWNHNFVRLWRWEQASWQTDVTVDFHFAPQPYARTGPGVALDGKPRFDLTRFDQSYFDRLRERVLQARHAGLYVSVMLFNGWSIESKDRGLGNPWRGHPFHRANNINRIDGDADGDSAGLEVHTLADRRIVEIEERYVAKVIATIADLDNVLFEISNESRAGSIEWQFHMVQVVKRLEAKGPLQHPIGVTATFPGDDSNQALETGPADWISPHDNVQDPPPASGRKVVLWDTDHLCGICGDRHTAWQAFTRGYNVVFMDPFDSTARAMDHHLGADFDPQRRSWRELRANLGAILSYAGRLPLGRMMPRPELVSTGYALADSSGDALLAYAPDGGRLTVDLAAFPHSYAVEWYAPRSGKVIQEGQIIGGGRAVLRPPFWRNLWLTRDAVLLLRRT